MKKQIRRRELATQQVENEAQASTYMPVTNNLRRQENESSSLSIIVNRENRAEKAREQFKEGKICVDCLKKVEIGAGRCRIEAMVSMFVAHWNFDDLT
jgi:7-keto-8-aminopelargonate synthetase-like enzyme